MQKRVSVIEKSSDGYVRVIPRPRDPLLDSIDIIRYARGKSNGPENVRIVDPVYVNNTGTIKFDKVMNVDLLPVIYDVDVSGVNYQIIFMSEDGFNCMEEAKGSAGLCDTDFKKIYVHIMSNSKIPDARKIHRIKTTLRHELTHAFIYESGLDIHTDPLFDENWAINEEAIDWYAHKIPHMAKTFEELGILE